MLMQHEQCAGAPSNASPLAPLGEPRCPWGTGVGYAHSSEIHCSISSHWSHSETPFNLFCECVCCVGRSAPSTNRTRSIFHFSLQIASTGNHGDQKQQHFSISPSPRGGRKRLTHLNLPHFLENRATHSERAFQKTVPHKNNGHQSRVSTSNVMSQRQLRF